MATDNGGFKIVVGFDFSDNAKLALADALVLASLHKVSALHVIGVVERPRALGRITHSTVTFQDAEKAQKHIAEAVHAAAETFDTTQFKIFVHARIGDAAEEILGLAKETGAGLIVVGTHGYKGFQRMLMGSVAEKVVRLAPCPVLVMRPTENAPEIEEQLEPEPPCPACVARRAETDGATWWCDLHGEDVVHPDPYHYSAAVQRTGMGSWEFYNR